MSRKPGTVVKHTAAELGAMRKRGAVKVQSEDDGLRLTDPFETFSEWSSEADEKAYADL